MPIKETPTNIMGLPSVISGRAVEREQARLAREATARRFVLWGWRQDDAHGAEPIKLTSGTQRQCSSAQRERENHHSGWLLGIYAEGDAPTGLRLQVEEIRNGAK